MEDLGLLYFKTLLSYNTQVILTNQRIESDENQGLESQREAPQSPGKQFPLSPPIICLYLCLYLVLSSLELPFSASLLHSPLRVADMNVLFTPLPIPLLHTHCPGLHAPKSKGPAKMISQVQIPRRENVIGSTWGQVPKSVLCNQ